MRQTFSERIVLMLAQLFGIGLIPKGSGTVASIATLLLLIPAQEHLRSPLFMGMVVALTLLAIPICSQAERLLGQKDSSRIVLDEGVGMLAAAVWLPASTPHLIMGCAFFRVFDIAKPGPVRWAQDHLPGGFGVVLDDLIAGALANITVHLVLHLFAGGAL